MKLIKTLDDYIQIIGTPILILPYWIEQTNKIWMKISLSVGENTIYVYYGNNNAPDYSDGDTVFDFFDDFDGDSLDTNKWDGDVAGFSVVNSLLKGSNTSYRIFSTITFSSTDKLIFETRHKCVNTASNGYEVLGFYGSSENGWLGYLPSQDERFWDRLKDVWECRGSFYCFGSFYLYTIKINDENYHTTISDTTYDFTGSINFSNLPIALSTRYDNNFLNQSYEAYWDWIRVRKYAGQEPTITYGEEENGSWVNGGYTYTKRKKVIINSSIELTDYQLALDYNEFQTNSIVIIK